MFLQVKKITRHLIIFLAPIFWFGVGFLVAAVTLMSLILIYFHVSYKDKALPGIFVGNDYVGEKTRSEIEQTFNKKNESVGKNKIVFSYFTYEATVSAQEVDMGYDAQLLATQAVSLGKSGSIISDFYMIVNSYLNGTSLPLSFKYNKETLKTTLQPIQKALYIEPVDALFTVDKNKVTAFRQSSNGRTIDFEKIEQDTNAILPTIVKKTQPQTTKLPISVTVLEPKITTEKANNFGIVEVIGEGSSTFFGSIPNRVHNVSLASSKINGVLVAPNEEFSFNKAVGDVSKFTGYKEAYVIQNGRTVLGDGGGLCQVSTTLFRAILNSGLPITERHAHSYRVGYYEQNSGPGLDATVFVPSVDFKFKNDTGHHILIQAVADTENYALTFVLYGQKDDRVITVTKPVITKQIAPPETTYQDDPTLPKGQEKQVEHAAWGASVVFTRTVSKNGKVVINDTFATNYQPWRAVYLRGTRE